MGMEGTMIKELRSAYQPGKRTHHWVKVRHILQADCVIGGFVAKGAEEFGSLLVGQYDRNDQLIYIGHVGSGFTTAENMAIASALKRITRSAPPFAEACAATRATIWVEPVLVCVVEHLTWTSDGALRHPVFRGIRTDKETQECRLSSEHPLNKTE
jgi:ATP-dependent DNA ligase